MKLVVLSYILAFFSNPNLYAQNDIRAGGMSFFNTVADDSILVKINAPTQGWLAVGFNSKNEIVGSDLKMFRMRNGQLEAEDQFVRGFQDHPNDQRIGGSNDIKLLGGTENEAGTSITFKIPLNSNDRFDFSHQINRDLWLILTYSVDDEFGHHSMMRKHFQIKWFEENTAR